MNRLFEEFLLFKADNDGLADRSVRAYRDILVRYEAWLDGRDPLEVNGDQLLAFCGPYLHKQLKLAPVSRTPYVACIHELYRYLSAVRGLTGRDPSQAVPYPRKPGKLPRVATLDTAERLMWAPDFNTFEGVRDAAMLALLLGCGLRVSGLAALNEGNLTTQVVDGEPRLALKPIEKGGKERLIPVPREADLLLRVYMEHPDLEGIDRSTPSGDRVLFITTRNRRCPAHEYYGERRRFSTRGVFAMIQRHGKAAGIPEEQLNPHALRHLFGTELAEGDIDLLERQNLMGHKDPKSTAIYTHLAFRKLTKSVDQANPLAKVTTPVSQLLGEMSRQPSGHVRGRR
ncbi:tyrosine-type recombinase/integrase [Pseudogulbenkiania ferrooxidans]|uniref:Integrase family protein n=1 Tax=Pseudogulbenkiania ferrooxidans 2002 TaxID=279714 RepID=B9Z4V9_9NEIS|nr:tyrosine-type recombinase/integrase [Pseudogulbenkiania ferrooxidans]EEG08191.1 integrase family protein [Pseudogulbenkiania ferrooxidans 2002]